MHNLRPLESVCDQKSPTSVRPANAQGRRRRNGEIYRRWRECCDMDAKNPAARKPARVKASANESNPDCRSNPREFCSAMSRAESIRFKRAPFIGRDDKRNRVNLPRTFHPARVAIDIVSDSLLMDESFAGVRAPLQIRCAEFLQRASQFRIMWTHFAIRASNSSNAVALRL